MRWIVKTWFWWVEYTENEVACQAEKTGYKILRKLRPGHWNDRVFSEWWMNGHQGENVHTVRFRLGFFPIDHAGHQINHLCP